MWDSYVEGLENKRSLNTLHKLKKHWRNTLIETLETVGDNHLAIRKYLIENKTFSVALEVLRNLEKSSISLVHEKRFTIQNLKSKIRSIFKNDGLGKDEPHPTKD